MVQPTLLAEGAGVEPNKTTAKMRGPLPLYSLYDQLAVSLLGRMSSKFLSSVALAVVKDTCFGIHVQLNTPLGYYVA
jgi:hypothetical protein